MEHLAICQKSWKPSFWEVIDSCFISICQFGSFKNSFATITRFRIFYSCKWKKWFLQTMAATQAVENHRDEWGLTTWYLLWRIHTSIQTWTPFTKFASRSSSTDFKDILPWNISQIIAETILISTRIVMLYKSYALT